MKKPNISRAATEATHQIAIFDYAAIAKVHGFTKADQYQETRRVPRRLAESFAPALPMLEWLHAIPNGGARGDSARTRGIRGNQLKAEGALLFEIIDREEKTKKWKKV